MYRQMFGPVFGSSGNDHLVLNLGAAQDAVAKPEHYRKGAVSPYDVGESMYGKEGKLIYVLINSIKYIQRYPHKYKGAPDKQLEDLIKARQSLDTAIELHKELNCDATLRHG
jgi:hypothetical protein